MIDFTNCDVNKFKYYGGKNGGKKPSCAPVVLTKTARRFLTFLTIAQENICMKTLAI